ncbi:SAM-dependent methyltransferase [Rugosimonospora africana]|uniref:S-adenosyl methyltransferase n=1 Tax=Rugosimonospora africana TaxID=556532 RepID=A0A8J3VSU8_9ACTN|nr:SAM-dependent methyltransferase [Rugosimonospora africana]GIH17742.1 hypothetical protein Raf01_59140 [Rugosimonospora africana]
MNGSEQASAQKPATAARMYDYYLGGFHNFRADQEAAERVLDQFPHLTSVARVNRAFLGRAVRYMVDCGIRQFLDVGSGIPTAGNVHEIAQAAAPEARVTYVDIDPVAVAESLEILEGNGRATAIRADMRHPETILAHKSVRELLDFDQPIGLLLAAVLHFVPEDDTAYGLVRQLLDALPPGSYMAVSHIASESFVPSDRYSAATAVYQQQTSTPVDSRSKPDVERFFAGIDLVEPGVVWGNEWRPAPGDPEIKDDDPLKKGVWAGVGHKR